MPADLFCKGFLALAISLFTTLFLFTGCAPKSSILIDSEAKLLTFSTSQFRFNDTGFLKHYADRIVLETYQAGNAGIALEILDDSICISGSCYDKERVSREIFGDYGYATLLEEILLGREIFGGEGTTSAHGIVRQVVVISPYHIIYERGGGKISFSERYKKTILIIKEL